MTVTMEGAATSVVALDDLKTYLKITLDDDDALLGDLIGAAADMAERFTGQILVDRAAQEVMPVTGEWQRLGARPVRSVTGVVALTAEGTEFALSVDSYAIDIDRNGDGWVLIAGSRRGCASPIAPGSRRTGRACRRRFGMASCGWRANIMRGATGWRRSRPLR